MDGVQATLKSKALPVSDPGVNRFAKDTRCFGDQSRGDGLSVERYLGGRVNPGNPRAPQLPWGQTSPAN
jgi:hypothetical protein